MKTLPPVFTLAALVLGPVGVTGQGVGGGRGVGPTSHGGAVAAAGVVVESYGFAEEHDVGLTSITLVTTPFAAGTSAGPLRLTVSGAWARGTVTDADGLDSSLSGFTDTELRLRWDVVPGQVALTARGFLPTGLETHDPEESAVAGVVATDLLPFRVSTWGTGGGILLEGAASRRFGPLGAGVSLGWGRSAGFEPLSGEEVVYRPGNQISARIALDAEVGRGMKGSLLVGVRRYDEDTMDGRNLFRSGDRVEGLASLGFPTGAGGSAAVYAGLLHRAEGSALLEAVPGSPSQDLVLFGGVWRVAVGAGWLQPRADLRLFRSEDGVGQGHQLGIGSSAEFGLGRTLTVVPVVIGRIGDVRVREGLQSAFTGAEIGLTLRFGR